MQDHKIVVVVAVNTTTTMMRTRIMILWLIAVIFTLTNGRLHTCTLMHACINTHAVETRWQVKSNIAQST